MEDWARLRYVGEGETPTDVYSFIALPNKGDYEICFNHEQALLRFSQIFYNNIESGFWKTWEMTTSAPNDIKYLVIKFWTGRIPDEDVEHYNTRFCDILQPGYKPLDQFGLWYGVRRYKVKVKKKPRWEFQEYTKFYLNGTLQWENNISRPNATLLHLW